MLGNIPLRVEVKYRDVDKGEQKNSWILETQEDEIKK
jgi:hypothetical protein